MFVLGVRDKASSLNGLDKPVLRRVFSLNLSNKDKCIERLLEIKTSYEAIWRKHSRKFLVSIMTWSDTTENILRSRPFWRMKLICLLLIDCV